MFPFLSTNFTLLPSLLLLETVLSADNALALASLLKPVQTDMERRFLLNWGMGTAIVLRLVAIAAAGAMLQIPLVRILGGAYLVWLGWNHFRGELATSSPSGEDVAASKTTAQPRPSRLSMVLLLAATNLAFSLDSICAALALTDDLPLVMLAGAAGVVVLRGVAGWLLRWMEDFPNLANAGYLTVLAVGLRLMVEQVMPALTPPDPIMLALMMAFLGWGFLQPQPARP
jgi:YkoY family integral membrane protein